MSTSLPPLMRGPRGTVREERPSTRDGGGRGRPPRTRTLVALMAATAVLGGAAGAGVLAVSGRVDGGTTTTVIRRSAATTATAAATTGTLDAAAVHAAVAPGVVEITASAAAAETPFGPGSQGTGATGSGFVADAEGHIVTAAHVVDGADRVTVTFADGTSRTATVSGTDDATDVAVLTVDPEGLTLHPLELGDSSGLEVGEAVAAVGSPFGYESSISTGIVSGLDRTIEAPNGFTVAHAIQIDAALNPGNSGGPIVDAEGRVIGIADQIATGGAEQSAGVGFAVPIDLVADEIDALAAGRAVAHPYLGVATGESAGTEGALVASVAAGGPADAAGLRQGDVVTAIGGARVSDGGDLVAAVAARDPGDEVGVTVRRGSETLTVTVTLGTQPATAATG